MEWFGLIGRLEWAKESDLMGWFGWMGKFEQAKESDWMGWSGWIGMFDRDGLRFGLLIYTVCFGYRFVGY